MRLTIRSSVAPLSVDVVLQPRGGSEPVRRTVLITDTDAQDQGRSVQVFTKLAPQVYRWRVLAEGRVVSGTVTVRAAQAGGAGGAGRSPDPAPSNRASRRATVPSAAQWAAWQRTHPTQATTLKETASFMSSRVAGSPISAIRRASIAAVVTALIASALLVVSSDTASAAKRGPGYRIPSNGTAAGGWIGARTLNQKLIYQVDPSAKNRRTGYRSSDVIARLPGGSHASRRQTQRAAYVLSVYGTRNNDIQAAAVDATVLHLLAGGKWRVARQAGAKRIRAAGRSAYVKSYARTMLKISKKYAGPVKRSLTASRTTVGGTSRVVFTIRNARRGTGMAGLPVTFRYAGAAPFTSYTNSAGRATAYVAATTASGVVKATVGSVPEWRLHVRKAKKRKASPVAVAGAKVALTSKTRLIATGAQSVTVSNTTNVASTGQALTGRYSIAGGAGSRSVTRSLRGPFSTSSTSCTGGTAYTSTTTIADDGSWALPSFAPTKSGYYRWTVAAGGNDFSIAATGCGAPVRVRKQASVNQFRLDDDTNDVSIDKKFQIGARVAGFDRVEAHTLTSRLYGPYKHKENVDCDPDRRVSGKTVTKSVSSNGDVTMPGAVIGSQANVGWYGWQTTLNNGVLITGDVSTCGVLFHVTE